MSACVQSTASKAGTAQKAERRLEHFTAGLPLHLPLLSHSSPHLPLPFNTPLKRRLHYFDMTLSYWTTSSTKYKTGSDKQKAANNISTRQDVVQLVVVRLVVQ